MGDHHSIDRVGLGALAKGPCEGPHLRWIDHHHGKASASQARYNHCLKTAGSLDCYQCRRLSFEPGDEILDPGSSAFKDETLAGRTNRYIQPILRHIDADHHRGPSDPILAQTGSYRGPSDCSGSMERQARTRTPLRALQPIDFSASRLPPRCHQYQAGGTASYKDFWPIVTIGRSEDGAEIRSG